MVFVDVFLVVDSVFNLTPGLLTLFFKRPTKEIKDAQKGCNFHRNDLF